MSFDDLPPGVKPDDVAPSESVFDAQSRRDEKSEQIYMELMDRVEDLEAEYDRELVDEVLQDIMEERA